MKWQIGMDLSTFSGEVKIGDLLEAKPGMLLVDPHGPMIVLKETLPREQWEVMYLSNNYVTCVDRIDIKSVISS